jgi:hypothetical protein
MRASVDFAELSGMIESMKQANLSLKERLQWQQVFPGLKWAAYRFPA